MNDTNALQISNMPAIDSLDHLIKSYKKGEDGGGAVLWFHNRYGLSISWRYGTYGGLEGAVLHEDEEDLVYDTPVTYDVVGWLNQETLIELIKDVAALPERTHTMATQVFAEFGRHGWDSENPEHELFSRGATHFEEEEDVYTWYFEDGSVLVIGEDGEEVMENPRLRMK